MTNEEFTKTYVDSLTEQQAKELLIVLLSAFSAISRIAAKKTQLTSLNTELRKEQK